MRFEKRATTSATPERAFAYLSDLTRHPEWSSHGLKIAQSSPGAVAVGTTFTTEAHQFGKQNDAVTITELEPGRRIAFETSGKAGVVRHWFEVGSAAHGATITKGMEFVKMSAASKIASPGIRLNVPRALTKDLDRIKTRLESAG